MSDFLTVLRTKLQTKIDERTAAKAALDAILAAPAGVVFTADGYEETIARIAIEPLIRSPTGNSG